MKISVITTCMGRLDHIKQTVPVLHYQKPDEHIVVDWSCPDKTGEWLKTNYPNVKVVEVPGKTIFNIAAARNIGAQNATGDWLMFVDADTLVLPKAITRVRTFISLLGNNVYIKSERTGDLWGFTICKKSDWEKVKYNEQMEGWGFEDEEFDDGLRKSGLIELKLDRELLSFIPHGDSYRVANYADKDRRKTQRINKEKRRDWGVTNFVSQAEKIDGWMEKNELMWLATTALSHPTIIEVGSWKGRSTKAIASATSGVVYAIDTWEEPGVFEAFEKNLDQEIGIGKLVPIKSSSSAAIMGPIKDVEADFIFIDADHSYEAVSSDIKNYLPLVKTGGIISGHDYSDSWSGVMRAVDELIPDMQRGPGSIWYAIKQ